MQSVPLRQYWTLLRTYLTPLWTKVLLLAALIFGTTALQVANPQIIRYVLDTATGTGAMQPLLFAGLTFLGAALILQVATVAATYVSEDIGWTATNALRQDLALHCLRLDMSFHNDRTPGEMIERIDGDVANLAIFFSQFVVKVLGSLLLLVGVLLALLLEDWRISLALSVYAVVALFILARMQGIAEPYWKAAREASAALFGFLEEQLAGTEDTRASGATPYVMRNLFRFGRDRLKAERQAGVASTYMVMTWLGLFTVGQLIAYTTGYYLHQDGLLTIGAVYLIVFYTDAIYRPLEQITEQIQNLQKAGASIGRVQELYHTPIRILDGEHTLPDGALGVSFEQVRFSYEQSHAAYRSEQPNHEDTKAQRHQGRENGVSDDTADLLSGQLVTVSPDHPVAQSHDHAITQSDNHPITQSDNHPITQSDNHPITQSPAHKLVLDGVSFALAPGEVLGLLGRTGSGKTTVTRLLFRLYEPQGGAIRLNTTGDSVELRETMLDDLRHKVGMVTQDVQLFRASVRDNLTFFDRTITDEQIVAALAQLGLGEWFNDLSDGLDTQLTSGAAGLSAGEAQLLAFTRVFLKNPGLVIMDEASSRLDPATEARIERAIDKLLAGRTGIIVAHRLATVHRADKILILEAGKVREFGIYSELVADPASRFAELLRTGEMQEVLAA